MHHLTVVTHGFTAAEILAATPRRLTAGEVRRAAAIAVTPPLPAP